LLINGSWLPASDLWSLVSGFWFLTSGSWPLSADYLLLQHISRCFI
jgi:hypothetical protein